MDRLIYERDFDGELEEIHIDVEEAKKIEFEFTNNLNIYGLKTIFIRLAKALGYKDEHVLEILGKPEESPEELQVKERISKIIHEDADAGNE